MGNKIWIILHCFCSVVFAAGAFLSIWMGIEQKEFWDPLLAFLWMSFLTCLTAKFAISRIKYGPDGPPPDELDNFHIDF